jgi:hypothetical protein
MTPEERAETLVTEWQQAYPTTRWMTDGAALGLEDRIVAAIKDALLIESAKVRT